ncbi:MAG: hypothetical protein IKI06_10395 [Prevotella sp.]|nr:hypothetical protein [Prevotella sp.]
MTKIKRMIMMLVALFAMTMGAWADGTVYNSSVDINNLQPDDILVEGASVTGIESSYGLKLMPYFLQSQDDEHYSLQSSSQAIASSGYEVRILEGGVLEKVRNSSRYTYTPCDADRNPFNAWIVTEIEDLGSGAYRVQIIAYQYGSAEVEANINPGEKTNLLDKFNQAKNSGLTVNVGTGDNAYTLNFDKEAVNSILEGNPEEVNIETTYEEEAQKIGTTSVLAKLIVNLTNGSQALNFNAGKVIASLKFLGNVPTGKELQTWFFDNVKYLPTELIPTVYDAINKVATVTMSHFSTYGLLLYDPDAIMVTPTENENEWTFQMPAGDVELEIVYKTQSQMMLTYGVVEINAENGVLVSMGQEAEFVGNLMYSIDGLDAAMGFTFESDNTEVMAFGDDNKATGVLDDIKFLKVGEATLTVKFAGNDDYSKAEATVKVTVEPTYSIALMGGTEDAENWEIDPAEGTADAVKAGTKVALIYNGEKTVSSVTAWGFEPTTYTMGASIGGDDPWELVTGLPYKTTLGAVYEAIMGSAPNAMLTVTNVTTNATNITIGAIDGWNTKISVTGEVIDGVLDVTTNMGYVPVNIYVVMNDPDGIGVELNPDETGRIWTLPEMLQSDVEVLVDYEEEEVPTGIGSLKAGSENGEMFNLNGQRLSSKPAQKGIYIIDGTKVVIK